MKHHVRIIEDHELPAEVPWAFVRRADTLTFMLRRSLANDAEALAEALEEAWATRIRIDEGELLAWSA